MSVYERMPDGSLRTAVPEPFWYRGWKTLGRWRPACYCCLTIYKNRSDYDDHFIGHHAYDAEAINESKTND